MTAEGIHITDDFWGWCQRAECGCTKGNGHRETKEPLEWCETKAVCNTKSYQQCIWHLTNHLKSTQTCRCASITAVYLWWSWAFWHSMGASESLGTEWQVFGALWLQMEATLSRSGRTDLSFTKIHKSFIPEEWKEWMNVKLMNINVKWPMDSFVHVLTSYLKSLPWKSAALLWQKYGAAQKRQAFWAFYFVSIGRQNNRCQKQLENQFKVDQTHIQHYSNRSQLERWIHALF